ncbi:MAG: hypothetical protein K0U84_12050 [Actinomycetia bacterium]|nr:hypothetical protein [Actinomycetes bacterium]
MPNHVGTDPDGHANDAGSDGGIKVADDIEASRKGLDEATSVTESAQLRFLSVLSMALGVLILVPNVLIAQNFWPNYRGNAVALALMSTSLLIGVFLIIYGAVVWNRNWSIRWAIILPIVAFLLAPGITVWSTQTARPNPEPLVKMPCIDLYQRALEIKKDNPGFVMSAKDPDQRRCDINSVLQ